MILKLSLAITFLFGTTIAAPVNEEAPYSIGNLWKISANSSKPKCKPVWINGVQKYHDDIIEALNKFPGPLKDQADNLTISFENYLTELVNYSNSNSKVLSTGSTAILLVLSEVKLQANTAEGIINEFFRVLPSLTKAYGEVITKLSKIIGEKASCSVNDAMADLECAYTEYMTKFLQEDENGLKKEVDYKPITKSAETLKKSVARKNSKCSDPDTNDANIVLNLILDHLIICYFGLRDSSQSVLYEQKCTVPVVKTCKKSKQ